MRNKVFGNKFEINKKDYFKINLNWWEKNGKQTSKD